MPVSVPMAASPRSESSSDSENDHNNSRNPSQGPKVPAAKDKECPYCHQHFTSSSLGRHLDQFISKKKPDGIHNVDEIRRLRGGITRRTARGTGGGSASKKDSLHGDRDRENTKSLRASPSAASSIVPMIRPNNEELNRIPPGGLHVRLNRLNWQATGVITDPTSLDSPILPAPPTPALISSPSTTTTTNNNATQSQSQPQSHPQGTKRSYTTYTSDLNNPDTTRALELALREVLDSFRAATKHASPQPSPFNFDVQAQTFPSLCLKLLPFPATLFQPSPFSTPTSIPLSPPGPEQVMPLRQKVTQTIDYWKWQALRLAQPTSSNIAEEADFLSRSAQQWSDSTLAHLDSAYQSWMSHPLDIRILLWHIELLRAYHAGQTRVTEMEEKLESLQQEANQLQQQVEYLSKCQWPREMALWPPERRTWGKEMREELRLINLNKLPNGNNGSNGNTNAIGPSGGGDSGLPTDYESSIGADHNHINNINSSSIERNGPLGTDKWDFDRLVNKWKAHVKEDRSRRMPFTSASTININTGTSGSLNQGPPGSLPTASGPPASGIATPDTSKYVDFRRSQTELGNAGLGVGIGISGAGGGGGAGAIYGNGSLTTTTSTPGGGGGGGGVNGISPGDEEKRRITRQKGNISIVSDY